MDHTVLGRRVDTGEAVTIDSNARSRGMYVLGTTGSGKTTLLQSIAYQDMMAEHGLCVLDPHGDMIDFLLARIPRNRSGDVILFNPADVERPYGLNLLECDRNDTQAVRWVVSTLLTTLQRLFSTSWGPRLEHVLGHTLWTAMTIKDSTLVEVLLLLTDPKFRNEHVAKLTEPLLQTFWADFPTKGSEQHELVSSTVNKLTPFLLDGGMRNIIGQSRSTINIRQIMDNRKILLVNLSKGDLGENNSSLLGSVLVNLILIAGLSRRNMTLEARQEAPFHVIVDEYQNFASESFSVLQSEARKYAVDLVVAHQYRDQLDILNRGAALNVGNFVCFRTTGVDSLELANQFDNTPPAPEKRYEPIHRPSPSIPDVFIPERNASILVPQPRRMYSDVVGERANTLANLPPFRAQVKFIEKVDDKSFRLTEQTIDVLDPTDALNSEFFGVVDMARAEWIRESSRRRAPERKHVEKWFRDRTRGRASFILPPETSDEE